MAGQFDTVGNDSQEYWTSYLTGAEPCHFPRLDVEIAAQDELRSVPVELKQLRKLKSLSAQDAETLPSMLRAAWALVLRCYTGTDNVSFGFLERSEVAARKGIEATENTSVARLNFQETSSLLDVIQRSRKDYIRGLQHRTAIPQLSERPLFDTSILLQTEPESEESSQSLRDVIGKVSPERVLRYQKLT